MTPTIHPQFESRQLLAIAAVAEYGSVTAAAEYLKLSQSALSRLIGRVEKSVGVTLFKRTTRSLEITAAGRDFVSIGERMLADFQVAVQSMLDAAPDKRRR